jgi:GNAT superfamily N-acetyltransferase
MTGRLKILPATSNDVHEAAFVLLEVVRWLENKGELLWTPEQVGPSRLEKHVVDRELYVARLNGAVVGTFLLQWQDRFAWPDVPQSESAFIHKLAVRRDVAGSGAALEMLRWAADRAAGEGRRYLRLDCVPRAKLCAFYEAAGFRRHSEVQRGRFMLVRYEMPLEAPTEPTHRASDPPRA